MGPSRTTASAPPTGAQVLAKLKALGSEQTRKTYRRHGVGDNMFGVSYGDLGKLTCSLKTNQPVALELWDSGNHDARVLATMVADPLEMSPALLDQWARETDNPPLAGALSQLAARTASAGKVVEAWIRAKEELIACAGWLVLGKMATLNGGLSDTDCEKRLDQIERAIHGSQNLVKNAMNSALIAIGLRNEKLQKKALATAKRVGKVEVDHGDTACKTPDATAYILKAAARAQSRGA